MMFEVIFTLDKGDVMSKMVQCSFCKIEFDPKKTKPIYLKEDNDLKRIALGQKIFCSHNCKQQYEHNLKKDW